MCSKEIRVPICTHWLSHNCFCVKRTCGYIFAAEVNKLCNFQKSRISTFVVLIAFLQNPERRSNDQVIISLFILCNLFFCQLFIIYLINVLEIPLNAQLLSTYITSWWIISTQSKLPRFRPKFLTRDTDDKFTLV